MHFFLLVIVLLLFLFRKADRLSERQNSSFASEPKKKLPGIEFTEGSKKLNLEKKERMVNKRQVRSKKKRVLFILRILKEIRINPLFLLNYLKVK